MNIFLLLLFKIIPLYFIILLGYVAGKYLKIKKETVAKLLIFIISPVVIFNSVFTIKISINILFLPVLFFSLGCIICLTTFFIAKKIWSDSTRNILAFTSGIGNASYFGFPVAITLFGPNIARLVLIAALGFILFQNSLGFYMTARGHFTMRESLRRVIKLPTIYAFFTGLVANFLRIKLGQSYLDFVSLFQGTFSVLGVMLIGIGLANIKNYQYDFKFIVATLLIKFIIWPLLIFLVIFIDSKTIRLFNQELYKVMILVSIVPLAANTVAFASELKTHPEKAAMAVLISTMVALFYIPFVVGLFFS